MASFRRQPSLALLLLCAGRIGIGSIGSGGSGITAVFGLDLEIDDETAADDRLYLAASPPTDFCAARFEAECKTAKGDWEKVSMPTAAETEAMLADALSWAACNGLLMRIAIPALQSMPQTLPHSTAPPLYTHAPFALTPADFPEGELRRAADLAPKFNRLVEAVAADLPWLERTLRDTVASDAFTRKLLKLCATASAEGPTQRACFAILRSDYMLHDPYNVAESEREAATAAMAAPEMVADARRGGSTEDVSSGGGDGGSGGSGGGGAASAPPARLLQVELNTIASSFASLSSRVSAMHATLAQRHDAMRRMLWHHRQQPKRLKIDEALPPNTALSSLATAIARAHAAYGCKEAAVVFVVQPDERNVNDQQLLRHEIFESHGVDVLFRTLAQIDQEGKLEGPKRKLLLDGKEISVVYFRAGYTPDDYPTSRQWNARLMIERSHAISCPSLSVHLAGTKKVQQELARPGELERFVSAGDAAELRQVFAGLWSLSGPERAEDDAPEHERDAAAAMSAARSSPDGFVMKPQREGGGNNLFGQDLAKALSDMSRSQRSAYILMQRIFPRASPALLVRNGEIHRGEAVSELGVYSTFLRTHSGRVVLDQVAGHLVRTKLLGVNEGGVAAGFAMLNSPLASLKGRKKQG